MKIAILGTKGIPNNYGGYEQFAEYISKRFVERGHEVTVYNPHFHTFGGSDFNGVRVIHKYSPENILGGAANIIYDHLCLKDALKRDFDVIYEAGYHSVALAYTFLGVKKLKKPVIVTNMDGLEWRRSKWSKSVQGIIKKLEKIAVDHSPYLISDNKGIQKYLKDKYKVDSFYIPYGADAVEDFDAACLAKYDLTPGRYLMLIARIEPENNVETIINGHLQTKGNMPLLVVGNTKTKFGQYLATTYTDKRIQFVGGIYNKAELDSLRHFSLGYFHGHSVGGTNPSLLEAMASQSFIIAHDNPFNRAILDDAALYFSSAHDVKTIISNLIESSAVSRKSFLASNLDKVKTLYQWDVIVNQHEELFQQLLKQ
jgi:glycosyltransferase involved in cell wall biosynthesis